MLPEVGQRFGPYEILGRLGGGGMGLVFRAWDDRLHREVAIKLLHEDYKMPGMRERFLQEARAASALNHPNICTVFDIGEQNSTPYLVMELLEGQTLKDRIAHGTLPADEIVGYAMEIADALTVAHGKGIVHRDIKPANIFLVAMPTGRSQAKVLDFGLAKIGLEVRGGWESRTLDLTLAGSTVGTLAYMSPEQARGESLDLRSDLFSLGIVLYEMATGHVPFRGTTSALMFVQLFKHPPEPVRNWNESIPRELERIILKLLEKDRQQRFQTAKELCNALAKIKDKMGRGGWISKGMAAALPLGRATDPGLRHKGTGRRQERTNYFADVTDGLNHGSAQGFVTSTGVQGHSHVTVERALSRKEGAVAVDSGAMSAGRSAIEELPRADSRISSIDQDLRSDSSGRPTRIRASALSRSGSGATQFEYGVEELQEAKPLRKAPDDDAALEQLITASSTVAAQTRMRIMVVAILISIGVATVAMARVGLFRPLVLGPADKLLLTVIENRTTDKVLDGTIMQGIEIGLQQSESLNVLGGEAYRAGLKEVLLESGDEERMAEQKVALKVGARAYLYGEIRQSRGRYTISVDVLKSDSNDKVATLEETADKREDIPAAISRVTRAVRLEISRDGERAVGRSVSLDKDATPDVEALHAYAAGNEAIAGGRVHDALTAYQRAVTLDPGFVQAQTRVAWLYQSELAEVASAHAAEQARDASANRSRKVRMLAQFCYEMNGSGDDGRASEVIRTFLAEYPHDADGLTGLAKLLNQQGNFPEALAEAQRAYSEDPFSAGAYGEAERALIAMNRYDAALQIAEQSAHNGLSSDHQALIAAYLLGREDMVTPRTNAIRENVTDRVAPGSSQLSVAELYGYGTYLDNSGQLNEGLDFWKAAANAVSKTPESVSAQAYLLSQAAVNRAMAESCAAALSLVDEIRTMPKGPTASFNSGMAAALCGDYPYAEKTVTAMQENFPQNTRVVESLIPQLRIASELGINEPAKVLASLETLTSADSVSLAPYLRGMAHQALSKRVAAEQDFQVVLSHRGAMFMLGGVSYPVAQVGIARTYAANQEKIESAAAYKRFLTLWEKADSKQALVVEASIRSR